MTCKINRNQISIIVFIVCGVASLFISPAAALLCGIISALTIGTPFKRQTSQASKYLLQAAVVGLGFGMNLQESLSTGLQGMSFTIISVVSVMIVGVLLGRLLGVNRKNAYLVASGTAICGGSAIAAVAPVIDADENDTSLALATVFILNAIALLIFPLIGHALDMSQTQFGTCAAIAIHDTSSVVGAGAAYGEQALQVATTVKLTRALWIIPLALISPLLFRTKGKRASMPWFILLFVGAMLANTCLSIPSVVSSAIVSVSKHALSLTLFLIGCGLSREAIRKVGVRQAVMGVLLWVFIASIALAAVMLL